MTTTQYPPQYPPVQPQPAAKNGPALASLILGAVSLVANVLLVPTLLGLIFGIIGLSRASRLGRKGMAIGGIVLSIVGAVISIVLLVVVIGVAGKAATTAAHLSPSFAPTVAADGSGTANDGSSDDTSKNASAKIPHGFKAITDQVWFKWGRTDRSDQFLRQRAATVITPKGCHSLLVQANEYDEDGTNVGSAIASASNLDAGDKAKLTFTWSPDDGAKTLKVKDATCF